VEPVIVYISNNHLKRKQSISQEIRLICVKTFIVVLHVRNHSYLICSNTRQRRQSCAKIQYISNFGNNYFVLKKKVTLIS